MSTNVSGTVTDTHRVQYANNVELALQEMRDPLGDYFTPITDFSGKQLAILNLVGDTEAREDAPEGGDTPDIDVGHEQIWVKPKRFDWGKTLKVEDSIKALTDYQSPYTQSGSLAIVRKRHVMHAKALFGARLVGNEVPTSTVWAGSTVPVDLEAAGTPSRMSVRKALNGIRLMEEAYVDVDLESIGIALNAQQHEELYQDIQFTSADYGSRDKMEQKRIRMLLDMPLIKTQRIDAYDGTTYQAAMFCKSGMRTGPAWPLSVKSAPNPQRQFREHVYIEEWRVTSRTEDKKVVKILSKK